MKAILERRSIRKYTDEKITDEQIQMLLKAAFAAPSAGNKQSWQFIIVDEREKLDRLADASPNAPMLKGASHAIVVCGDTSLEFYPGYFIQDCAAAAENILIAAADIGLGGVWLGVYPKMDRVEKVAQVMKTPEGIVPFCMISLGYPAESKDPSNRYDANKVHYNNW